MKGKEDEYRKSKSDKEGSTKDNEYRSQDDMNESPTGKEERSASREDAYDTNDPDNDGDVHVEGENKGGEGIIPEEFQQKVHSLVGEAHTKHHTNYMKDAVNAKHQEHMDKEYEEKSKKRGNTPSEYSISDMPRD